MASNPSAIICFVIASSALLLIPSGWWGGESDIGRRLRTERVSQPSRCSGVDFDSSCASGDQFDTVEFASRVNRYESVEDVVEDSLRVALDRRSPTAAAALEGVEDVARTELHLTD